MILEPDYIINYIDGMYKLWIMQGIISLRGNPHLNICFICAHMISSSEMLQLSFVKQLFTEIIEIY